MSSLVDDLLDVSRVTRGLIELAGDRLDIKRVVADAVEQVRPLIEAQAPPADGDLAGRAGARAWATTSGWCRSCPTC